MLRPSEKLLSILVTLKPSKYSWLSCWIASKSKCILDLWLGLAAEHWDTDQLPQTISVGDNYTVIVMKICSKCKEPKDISEFQKDKSTSSGFRSSCKTCSYSTAIEWNRSRKGIVCRLWHKHNARSEIRGHNKPNYTKEWLFDFVLNHPEFENLYAAWVASDYNKMLAPSIDRINDRIGYTKENIRLVTFGENMEHAWEAGRKKELDNAGWAKGACSDHKAVVQLTMGGDFIAEYISVSEACRALGALDSKISMACSGKRKSHAGFRWAYLDDYIASGRKVGAVIRKSCGTKRKIRQFSKSGDPIAEFASSVDAGKAMGVSSGAITFAARNFRQSCGYYWRYCAD